MRIMIDAEPLLPERLTGIGYNQADTLRAYIDAFPQDEITLSGSALRGKAAKRARLESYTSCCADGKGRYKLFPLLSSGMYRFAWGLCMLPIPYCLFFGGAELTHFHNFLIPPGVRGKKVCTVHDLAFRAYPETVAKRTRMLLERQLGRTLRRADAVIVVSEFTKRELLKYYPQYPENSIHVVYNGVDSRFFSPREWTEESAEVLGKYGVTSGKFFFYLGTIEPRKNIARMIEAYADASERRRSEGGEVYPLVLGGGRGWYYDEIYAKAEQLGIADRVKFIGYLGRDEMAQLYSHCAAFVFPSLYEGFGSPVAEAMACGAAVITADAASLPEVGGDAAMYCDPLSRESIAEAFYRMHNAETAQLYKDKARAQAARFTWESAARSMRTVYEKVLSE